MKNIGTLLTCLTMFVACSTASVEVVKLSDGQKGYDVSCLGSLDKCAERARVLCQDGKYRIHNTFSDSLYDLTAKTGLTMRLQCLDQQANLEQCSQPGVRCVL